MNTNSIQISPILGTDSLSSSRIVINDNFKILANVLENYQEYFNENGVYASTITSKNEEGSIYFNADNNTIMKLSSDGIDLNGSLIVHGNLTVLGEPMQQNIVQQNISDFKYNAHYGYEQCYKNGYYIYANVDENNVNENTLSTTVLKDLVKDSIDKLIQYVNYPFTVSGLGLKISLDDNSFNNNIITNGKIIEDNNVYYIVNSKCNSITDSEDMFTVIKIYPIIKYPTNDTESPTKMLKFDFDTTL